ncbi:MAG: SDR family oxidoreductase [Cytophagales bacterium]|nr:MAG: SDR family oxidoreductase [Cytophagales bacterium]
MKIDLMNKTAMVGGASKGLGKAVAHQLAYCGASVTLLARDEVQLKEVIASLPKNDSQNHQYLVVDYTNLEHYKNTIDSFFESNQIDILVNNTNGPNAGTVLNQSMMTYQSAFDLLFQTVVYTTTKALVGMQNNSWGRIINMSSVTVKEPLAHLALSNSIRSALVSWGKTLATEIAKHQITVNNILTGYFDTERLNQIINKQSELNFISAIDIKSKMVNDIPTRRFGKPEEYGHLVAFLASEYASYITGASIPIDGGYLKSY